MMVFPTPKAMLARTNFLKLLYGPAVVLAVLRIYLNIVQPDSTTLLQRAWDLSIGLFIIVYLSSSVIAMVHSYFVATSSEKQSYGLNFMLLAIVIGLGPGVVTNIFRLIAPNVVFPGSEFYFLTMALIPVSLMLATTRKEISEGPNVAGA